MEITIILVALIVIIGIGIALRRKGAKSLTGGGQTAQPLARDTTARAPDKQAPGREPEADAADTPRAPLPPGAAAAVPQKKPDVEAPPQEPEPQPEPQAKPSHEDLSALRKGLKSTRGGFISRLAKLFQKADAIDPALLDEIEEVLITADVGVKTSQKILSRLRERLERNELTDSDKVWEAIREEARGILETNGDSFQLSSQTPSVVLVVGVNGAGKTTTIGKLASRFAAAGQKTILAAGDTFRAAAVLQLEVWGRRVGCPVVKGKERADPGSVIFDAIKNAQQSGANVVIADTAGRLHTKTPLMDELKKVGRTVEKALGRPADHVILVLDSTTGQNAIQQAQLFKEALPISGIVLTKLDGTAKGGVILGIVDEHEVPVRFIGIGERVEDLREFDARSFVEALFEKPDDESLAA